MSIGTRLDRLEKTLGNIKDDYWAQFKGLTFEQFWNIVGAPEKHGELKPIFQYEKDLLETFKAKKHIWVKKATGLGITEFCLRYIAWQATTNDTWQGKQVVIVTGPREELATTLIKRMKDYFDLAQLGKTKETVIDLNGCHIQAYPVHLASFRGLTNVVFILVDEADFFKPGQQQEARHTSERYIAKSNPWIVMVSTPDRPNGLFDKIEHEANSLYERLYLPYTVGLRDGMFTQQEIDDARRSPSFEREYNLKYGYGIGNVYKHEHIEAAIATQYDLKTEWRYVPCTMAMDPAFGTSEDSSKFAFIITAKVENKIRVYYFKELNAATYEEASNLARSIIATYNPQVIFIDGSRPDVVKAIKRMVNERVDFENDTDNEQYWRVRPVNFGTEGKGMLGNTQQLVSGGHVQIHPIFEPLILQMRVAETDDKGNLDKKQVPLDGIDCFRMACKSYFYGPKAITKKV